jgi:hypothetical protein
MKQHLIFIVLMLGFAFPILSQDQSDAAFEAIQKMILHAEKQIKNKAILKELKHSRKQMERVRELWASGLIPNSVGLLLDVRRNLYKYGSYETQEFQQNVRMIMKTLWPILLKTGRFRSDVHKLPGVTLVRIIAPEGTFTVCYPDHAAPGETISGRVYAAPEVSASYYLLSLMEKPVVPDGSLQKWAMPEAFDFVLSDHWGNEIVRVHHTIHQEPLKVSTLSDPELQEEKQPREAKPNIEIPHLRFEISSKVKGGGHLIVRGPFDGDFNTTSIGIGKYQGYIVAEAPGILVISVHPRMTGEWTILIHENDNWVRCRTNVQTEEVDPFATLATCSPPTRS